MLSIGEFSKATGLTVKALRFYHEQGLLELSRVDPGSGYRSYSESLIETARVITALRDLEFPIAEIKDILSSHEDDSDLLSFLESRRAAIQERMRNDRRVVRMLDQIITHEREVSLAMSETNTTVEMKSVEPIRIAGVRMKGKYSDCGTGFGKIGRKFGRHISGKPMLLCYDGEYREDDADFEAAMPVKKGESTGDIEVRELPGGRCLSVMHLGPYEELSRSYEKLLSYENENGLTYSLPTREVYHKGPGMIFKGNPAKYVTEIQLMLEG